MKHWALAALLLAACGDGEADQRREIEKPARQHEFVPLQNVDSARQTEAQMAFAMLYRQVRLAFSTSRDKHALYGSLNGRIDAAKLQTLRMTEAQLKGSFYVASDYTITINGGSMTIEASTPGTRGFTSAAYALP